MNKVSPIFTFLLLAILALSSGCARKPDDAKISSDIQSRFSQDSGLSSKQLTVQASSGVVTLSGFVDNDAQRQAAARQAAAVEGVKEVVNNLEVGTASNAPASSSESQAQSEPAPAATEPVPFKGAENKRTDRHAAGRRRDHSGSDRSASNQDTSAGNSSSANNTMAQSSEPPQITTQNGPPADVPPPPAPAPPKPHKITIEQGTQITVRLIDSIDSEKNQVGDTFHATLNAPLSAEGTEAIPAGTDVTGHIVDIKSSGKFAGQSLVVLQL